MRLISALLLVASLFGMPLADAAPAPNAVPIVVLDRPRTEPSVAIDPRDPRIIAVAVNPTYRRNALGEEPVGIFVSHDSGVSWTKHDAPLLPPYTTGSDPSVAFTPSGTLYVAYEAVSNGFCGSTNQTAVLVTRSIDQGRSFSRPTLVNSNPANDKPYMAAGSAAGGHGDAVYVAWIRFQSDSAAQVVFSRSGNGGQTFSPPVPLSSGAGIHVAPQLAAASGGRVYVGWMAGSALPGTVPPREWMETRGSFDAGAHFGPVGRTAPFWGPLGLEQPGSLRLFNGPSLAAGGQHRVYMVWAQAQATHGVPVIVAGAVRATIVMSVSDDAGLHWATPIAVNDSTKGDRFEPQVAASGNTALVAFYDRRRNGVDLDLELSVVHKTASGLHAGPNVRLTSLPAPIAAIPFIPPGSPCLAQGRFFGDYIGLALHGTRAGVAWTGSTSTYRGQTDVRFASVPLSALGAR
ncbi:MAG: BNR/Asp-box repeat-containing protein [Gemmatimonadales bacterium]|nr:BNR/Asp-box repeat-containing protein [Gemmatimonadales bacterium]